MDIYAYVNKSNKNIIQVNIYIYRQTYSMSQLNLQIPPLLKENSLTGIGTMAWMINYILFKGGFYYFAALWFRPSRRWSCGIGE